MIASVVDSISGLPAEILIGGAMLAVAIVYMFHQGRGRAIAAGLGLVVTATLYQAASTISYLNILNETTSNSFLVRIAFFVAILIVVVRLLNRGIHGEYTHRRGKMVVQAISIGVTFWGLFIAYTASLLHIGSMYNMSDIATKLFASTEASAFWLIALFISVVFLIKR